MFTRRMMILSTVALAGCATGRDDRHRFSTRNYRGPDVTRVVVMKERRRMYLMHGDQILKRYKVGLGFAPAGDKKVEGDGKTPEGRYFIDRRNPQSDFYLSLGISYPNAHDIAEAAALGQSPGGDIFIHGQPYRRQRKSGDWSAGCIAVKNHEMEEVFEMVQNGTIIDIFP